MKFYDYIIYRLYTAGRAVGRTDKNDGSLSGYLMAWGVTGVLEGLVLINIYSELRMYFNFDIKPKPSRIVAIVFTIFVGVFNFLYLTKRGKKIIDYYKVKIGKETIVKKYVVFFTFIFSIAFLVYLLFQWTIISGDRYTEYKEKQKQEEKKQEEGYYILKPEDQESDDE